MSSGSVKDMTQGNITKLLISFSTPLLMGNIFQQFYNMVDSVVVGNFVGSYALGAVGACSALNFLFFSLCSGIALGVGILISQFFGAGKKDMVKSIIINGSVAVLIIGILMGILAVVLAKPLLELMRTPSEYIEDAILYLRIVGSGTIAVAAYNLMSAMLQALGDSKTPLLFLVISSILNVGLDLLFVITFQWGVGGVAIATVIAQAVSAIFCMIYAMKKNPYFQFTKEDLKIDTTVIIRCLKQGVPLGLQNALISLSIIFLQSIANGFGAKVATAYTMTGRIEQLIHQPYNSLAAGLATFTGQNIGARQIGRVKKGLYVSLWVSSTFSVGMFLIMQFCSAPIMRLFGNDGEVIAIASMAIRVTSCFYILLGVLYMVRSLCNGAGDVLYPVINGVAEVFGRVFFALLLINVPGVGQWAVWLTAGLTWSFTAVISIIRYKQNKWMVGVKDNGTQT